MVIRFGGVVHYSMNGKGFRPFAKPDALSTRSVDTCTTTLSIIFNVVINIRKIDRCFKDA